MLCVGFLGIKVKILGIDPGLRSTGFGVIQLVQNKPYYISSGVIETNSKESLPLRLKTVLTGIQQIIGDTPPDVVAIEKVFVNNNPSSTLLLGQARGVAIAACVLSDLPVFEYTALQVKQSVVGYGHAEKSQVAKMVSLLLELNGQPKKDAADALAVALAHIHYAKICDVFNIHTIKKGRLIR